MAKTSLAALLVVGLALIPAGIIANVYLGNEIGNAVPSTLLTIQETAEGEIEDELWIVANADALEEIIDLSYEALPPVINATTTAKAIDEVLDGVASVANGKFGFNYINQTLDGAKVSLTLPVAIEYFFNHEEFNETIGGGAFPIKGVSEYWNATIPTPDGNLSYTVNAQNTLLYGDGSGSPGIANYVISTSNPFEGAGMLGFMELYSNATDNERSYMSGVGELEDAQQQTILGSLYNATWTQLEFVAGYIQYYLWDTVIDDDDVVMARELFFNDKNWSTNTSGLAPFNGISEAVWTTNLSFTPTAQNRILDGYGTLPGLLTDLDMGMGVLNFSGYMQAAATNPTLQAQMVGGYNATWSQLLNVSKYINEYMYLGVVPNLLALDPSEGGYGTSDMDVVIPMTVWQQWSSYALTDGDPLNLKLLEDELPEDVYGLEVGYSISYPKFAALFEINTENEDYAVTSRDGQTVWHEAWDEGSDSDAFEDLMDEFGLTTAETQAIADWLYEGDDSFQQLALPSLFEYDQGVTIARKAVLLFLEQWAWQTIDGDEEYPDGLPLGEDPEGNDITGIELAEDSEIELDTAEDLWDEDNELAFTNDAGIQKWYTAADANSDAYEELKDEFDLSDDQMVLITDWLQTFKSDTLPKLAEDQTGTNPALLQTGLTWGLISVGVVLALVGGILLKKRS